MSLQLFDEEGRRQNLVEGGPLNDKVDLQVDATTEDPALTGDLSSDEGGRTKVLQWRVSLLKRSHLVKKTKVRPTIVGTPTPQCLANGPQR